MVEPWLRLDNAAKLFPSVTSDRLTHLFRLAVTLEDPIDPKVLARALEAILPRFPSFQFRLEPGFFWYTLVREPSMPPVYPESTSPSLRFRRKSRGPHLFRVRWFANRLAVEFSHALTDGIGGLTFLRALTAEYLALQQGRDEDPDGLRRLLATPDPAEMADDFQTLYDPSLPRYETWDKAYQPPSRLLAKGQYAVTTGRLSLVAVLAVAKAKKATLTEFLAATLLAAFQETHAALSPSDRRRLARPIRLVLPVNLRSIFPSRTLRNFFVVVPVEIDLRLGTYDFDEILHKVHHQMQAEMDPKLLKKQIMRNLRGELNPLARLLPLPLKGLVLSGVYGSFERQHTASLSNLGRVAWPEPWASSVQHVEFTPPASPFCRTNAGVVSYGDTLSVTLGSLATEPAVERAFFTLLRRQGLAVRIESNRQILEA